MLSTFEHLLLKSILLERCVLRDSSSLFPNALLTSGLAVSESLGDVHLCAQSNGIVERAVGFLQSYISPY